MSPIVVLPPAGSPAGLRAPAVRCRGAARRGSALAEAVVAAFVLVVGVLATAGAVAGSARDARRARAVEGAAEVLAARVALWRVAPCVEGAGEQAAVGWREQWRVRAAGGLGVLADTVVATGAPAEPRVGVVAVAGCGP